MDLGVGDMLLRSKSVAQAKVNLYICICKYNDI